VKHLLLLIALLVPCGLAAQAPPQQAGSAGATPAQDGAPPAHSRQDEEAAAPPARVIELGNSLEIPPIPPAAQDASAPGGTQGSTQGSTNAPGAPGTRGAQDGTGTVPGAPAGTPAGGVELAAAVAAYRDGRYPEAAEQFARLAAAEPDAARAGVLHCNAGTAAARAERFGEALWHLRRARQALPRDARTLVNLERVRVLLATAAPGAAAAAPGADESPQFARTLRELPLHATLDETGTACAVVAALALLLLAGSRAGRLPRGAVGVAAVVLLASAGWWLFARAMWEEDSRRAVVIAAAVIGRVEPRENGEILFRLPAGTVVSDEEEHGAWRLVQSEGGARGWVDAAQVRPLR